MSRKKLFRYRDSKTLETIVEPGKPFFDADKGQWNSEFFGNMHPILLEVACGKGEYTIGLASNFPGKNVVGVDIKGARLWLGADEARQKGLTNVGFLRVIVQNLEQHFAPGEIDEIRIIHPDPRPKGADERRRLTAPRFLKIYESLLKPGGMLRLKTDDDGLFAFSIETLLQEGREILAQTTDLYQSELLDEHLGIRTRYEELFVSKGRTVKYLKATKTRGL